jgi:hypothetical protein
VTPAGSLARSGQPEAAPLPAAVLAGLRATPAHGYLDRQGTYHSALAPYTVRSHWQPREVGGPAPVAGNDRFTKVADQRYIDVLITANPQHLDTTQANRRMWGNLDQKVMPLHLLGQVRVLGARVPLVGVTDLETGLPHVWLVFATPQHVWMISLATSMWTWPRDLPELTYVATTFRLAQVPRAPVAPTQE